MTAPTTDNKPYKITFEDAGDHLYVRVEGDTDSYDITQMYWTEVAAEVRHREASRLFIEERFTRQIPSVADTYQAASERHEMGLGDVKIAFFDADPDQFDQNQFGELVARNRGVNVKVFATRTAALDWLRSEEQE